MKINILEKGITLIALVVTMIILLILAGITLSLILGNQGLLGRAQLASNTMAEATRNEMTKMNEYEEDTETLTEGFINIFNIIDNTGEQVDARSYANYYGKYVNYNGTTDQYQLFYVDTTGKYSNREPKIWLQYKTYTVLPGALQDQYDSTRDAKMISEEGTILWQINPDLNNKYGDTIRGLSSWNNNIKGVAYLSNPENWNDIYLAEGDEKKEHLQ